MSTTSHLPYGGREASTGSFSGGENIDDWKTYSRQEFETTWGLYSYDTRWMNPFLVTWLSVDNITFLAKRPTAGPYELLRFSPYVYVDPDGNFPLPSSVDTILQKKQMRGLDAKMMSRGATRKFIQMLSKTSAYRAKGQQFLSKNYGAMVKGLIRAKVPASMWAYAISQSERENFGRLARDRGSGKAANMYNVNIWNVFKMVTNNRGVALRNSGVSRWLKAAGVDLKRLARGRSGWLPQYQRMFLVSVKSGDTPRSLALSAKFLFAYNSRQIYLTLNYRQSLGRQVIYAATLHKMTNLQRATFAFLAATGTSNISGIVAARMYLLHGDKTVFNKGSALRSQVDQFQKRYQMIQDYLDAQTRRQ